MYSGATPNLDTGADHHTTPTGRAFTIGCNIFWDVESNQAHCVMFEYNMR